MSDKQPKYKVGDQVQLKSGGPKMSVMETITKYPEYSFEGNYRCQWFAGKKLDSGVFPEDSLQDYVEPTDETHLKKK